ncbi:MAG: TIGR03905 family TSCPD domain-containing protein [Alistipes sp.]|nr:TIGR03905 family TSCPD domain-containing protein [Alistipes sp.]
MNMNYTPSGVCSRLISFEVDGNTITSVQFTGGCAGNTQGVARLLVGMDIDDAINRLDGIKCGFKPTSCPDQLAQALKQYKAANQ